MSEPRRGPDALSAPDHDTSLAGNSSIVAAFTLISRVTGLLRVVVAAAVLGPTFFGNIFQATNWMPNLAYWVIAGPLIAALLVPPVVQRLDQGDPTGAKRVADGFLGVLLLAAVAVTALAIAIGPFIARLLTVGVSDPALMDDARRTAWWFVVLLMPQVVFYAVAGTGVAIQNAHHRFALAAAAPLLENLGVIATLVVSAVVFGTGLEVSAISDAHLLTLGIGTTASVGLHALAQWWGTRRVGMTMIPRAGWRDPDVRALVRLALRTIGSAILNGAQLLAAVVASGTIPGGTVAFFAGFNFFNVPVALGAYPVATASLPTLARYHVRRQLDAFAAHYQRGLALAAFVIAPAAVALVVLSGPLARAFAVGEMDSPRGVALLTAALAGMGAGVLAAGLASLADRALYARRDVISPVIASAFRAATTTVGAVAAVVLVDGTASLLAICLAFSVGDAVGAAVSEHRLQRELPRVPGRFAFLARTGTASLLMVLPSLAVAVAIPRVLDGTVGRVAGVAAAAVVGMAVYVTLHHRFGSPELSELRQSWRRDDPSDSDPDGPSRPVSAEELRELRGRPEPDPPTPAADPGLALATPAPRREGMLVLGAIGVASVIALPVGILGPLAILATAGVLLTVAITHRPALGAYLYIGTTPLVVGIDRDTLLPLLRPNEALLMLVVGALAIRWFIDRLNATPTTIRLTALERALVALLVTGAAVPLLWLVARGEPLTTDDILACAFLAKYPLIYLLVRYSVRTVAEVRTCLVVALASGAGVAVITIMQVLGVGPVNALLSTFWTGDAGAPSGRGTSTLGHSIAIGDLMVYLLAIVVGLLFGHHLDRRILLGLATLFTLAVFASGQFSAAIAFVVAIVVIGSVTGELRRIARFAVPATAVGLVALWPVISIRLAGFSSPQGLPGSWVVRWDNVTSFYLPPLVDGGWLLGVRPYDVLVPPETWRDAIYPESGYLATLWAGGIPFLAATVIFLAVAARTTTRIARRRTDEVGVAAMAASVAVWVVIVLMILDKHLTYRGAGDLLFVLLALATTVVAVPRRVVDRSSTRPPLRTATA